MRLAADRARRAPLRASQSSSQRELRHTIDREHVLTQEAETDTQRELRLTALTANGIRYPASPKPSLRGNYV